ncbi:MAG: hypothetical protein RIM99_13130 [Cyclobacteriaceae bacterium]
MKLIIRIILIGALTYFLSPFLHWWTGMVVAMVVCALSPSTLLNAFVAGFLGVGLVWLGSAWVLDVANESAFSSVIVQLFPIEDPVLLVLLAGLIGGISGGLAGTTGASFRHIFQKKKQQGYYD